MFFDIQLLKYFSVLTLEWCKNNYICVLLLLLRNIKSFINIFTYSIFRLSFSSCSVIIKRNRQRQRPPWRLQIRPQRQRQRPSNCNLSNNSNSNSSTYSNSNSWPQRLPDQRLRRQLRLPLQSTRQRPRPHLHRPERRRQLLTSSTHKNHT